MESFESAKRKSSPRDRANVLSILTFIFTFGTLRKGLQRGLRDSDIYEVVKNCRSERLGDKLEKAWELEKKKPKPSLFRPIIKLFGSQMGYLFVIEFIFDTFLIIMKPLLMGKVVSFFTPESTLTKEMAYFYATALLGCMLLRNFYAHTWFLQVQVVGMKIRVACSSLLYRKLLKLSPTALSKVSGGKIITLTTKDLASIYIAVDFLIINSVGMIQIVIMTAMMYRQIGISAVIGVAVMVAVIPVQAYLAKFTSRHRLKTAAFTDQRTRLTQEIITAIKIIKFYTWEIFFTNAVDRLRRKEIYDIRILFYIKAIAFSIGALSTRLAFYVCVVSYISFGNHITAEKAFVVTGCFAAITHTLTIFVPIGISYFAEMRASTIRVDEFMKLEEAEHNFVFEPSINPAIDIKNAAVESNSGNPVLKHVTTNLRPGMTVICGSVGSGKSTVLKLIVGDVNKSDGTVSIKGSVSYASQEPWLFPGTVRQNIVFGESFDEKRYHEVVRVCSLRQDFSELIQGDQTRVIDRGMNLSRGQKARINLARAVYKNADIYLLDDSLSAVDAHVNKHIFTECLQGYLRGKLVVLVTHNTEIIRSADHIVVLHEGEVEFQGSYAFLKEWNNKLKFDMLYNKDKGADHVTDDEEVKHNVPNGLDSKEDSALLETKLKQQGNIYEETNRDGDVAKEVYIAYFKSGGGFWLFFSIVVILVIAQVTTSWCDYFVSHWVDMEQKMSAYRVENKANSTEYRELVDTNTSIMNQYFFVIIAMCTFMILRALTFYMYCAKASINIHFTVFTNIINAAMSFFDKNLSGNIINRLSRDLHIVDEMLPHVIFDCVRITCLVLGILFVVSSVRPWFLVPSVLFAVLLILARKLYLPTSRSIRRLEGATRSPVVGHINASLEGLTTIRASQAQHILTVEYDNYQNVYNSVTYMCVSITRAFAFYLDMACACYIAVITFSLLYFKSDTPAGKIGLAISQCYGLIGLLQWGVRQWSELENLMTSTERVLEYTNVEKEYRCGETPPDWPPKGKVEYKEVSLKYSPEGGRILKDLSFVIEPREKVGVVGRTGAGKSSIISVLFHFYEFTGTIAIDDVDIKSVDVGHLRSKISIIPQDPVLFTGNLRDNLDPHNLCTDDELWKVLEEVEMKHQFDSLTKEVEDGGLNFSIGQRQLICLARALVRKNKVLILDEATSNMDPKTDAVMQKVIKKHFEDYTVITIAHRLNTVLGSDKVLVMDSGRALQYGPPKELLKDKDGLFYKLVDKSGLL